MSHLKYIYRILVHIGHAKSFLLIATILIANIIESIGIASLLPVLALASGKEEIKSELALKVLSAFEALGMPTELAGLCILVGAALILREIIMFLAMSYLGVVVADLAKKNRQKILSALLGAKWSHFSENELGDMSVSVTLFTDRAAVAVSMSARTISLLMRTCFYLILVVLISGVFAFVALSAGLISLALLSKFVSLSKKYGDKEGRLYKSLSAQFTDIFASIKPFKVMAREENISHYFSKNIAGINKTFKKIVFLKEGLASLQRIAELIVILITLYLAVEFWGLEIIEIGVIGLLMSQIMVNISKSQKLLQKAVQLDIFFWHIDKTIKNSTDAKELVTGRRKTRLEKHIAFDEVSFSFPGKKILDKASFSIPANKITVIYGESGQGKTTLTDLISRLYQPDGGAILVDGISIDQINLKHWRKSIGYVPQELFLLNTSIKENVKFGRSDLDDSAVKEALELSGSSAFVEELEEGVDSLVGEKGMKLSGGQRQRLSIARGLAHNPKLLILDEITSALDAENEKRICQRIKGLKKGRTIIAITHRPEWLKIADQVLHVKDGKVRSK